jgi:hypothetical protein
MPPRWPRTRFQNSRRARRLSRLKFAARSSSTAKSNSNAHSSRPKSNVCDGLLSLAPRPSLDPRTSQHHPSPPPSSTATPPPPTRHTPPTAATTLPSVQTPTRVPPPRPPSSASSGPAGTPGAPAAHRRTPSLRSPPTSPIARPSRKRRTSAAPRLLQRLPNIPIRAGEYHVPPDTLCDPSIDDCSSTASGKPYAAASTCADEAKDPRFELARTSAGFLSLRTPTSKPTMPAYWLYKSNSSHRRWATITFTLTRNRPSYSRRVASRISFVLYPIVSPHPIKYSRDNLASSESLHSRTVSNQVSGSRKRFFHFSLSAVATSVS